MGRDSTLTNYNTHITDFDVAYTEMYTWKEVDITKLAQSWLNYGKTSQNVGVASYGFKIITESTPKATVVANSERASYNHPYFEINYVVDSDYTLTYAPHKYDNIEEGSSNIYNFQNRMNCYAYALQTYYRGSGDYSLLPGEFSIGANNYIQTDLSIELNYLRNTPLSNYDVLKNVYTEFEDIVNYRYSLQYPSYYINILQQFVNEQIHNDAASLGFDLAEFSTGDTFSLPYGFDENNERVIAMVTYYIYSTIHSVTDYHFYLRNGNGTCPIHNNGVCSMWSHKSGHDEVKNTCRIMNNDVILCDQNIVEYSKRISNSSYTTDAIFYRISKGTDAYRSWHTAGNNSSNISGTPYYSY